MTTSSLFFMAKPPAPVVVAMTQSLTELGLTRRLGDALWPAQRWNQLFSQPLPSTPALRQGMTDIGAQLQGVAFTMQLNRLGSAVAPEQRMHWKFFPTHKPAAFTALQAALRTGMRGYGLPDLPGQAPQLLFSDSAPQKLPRQEILPIAWRVDELLLVECGSDGRHVETLQRWPLRPAPQGWESQCELWTDEAATV